MSSSLGWVRECAARGDCAEVLGWIGVPKASGAHFPHGYQAERRLWDNELVAICADPGTILTGSRSDARLVASYLNCPRCGLGIEVRARWLTIRHCPRCVARSQTVVALFGSGLPADAFYAADSRPHGGT
ncbi:MAG: hypothetical protein ACLP8S_02010 [Solirubrobacteraceae bacterium]